MKPTLTATRGLPASGKTSWAKEMIAAVEPGALARLNRDDLRTSMHGQPTYTYATEKQITAVQHGGVEALLRAGTSVIVDDTNLRAKNLRNLADIAWKVGAGFEVQDFTHVPLTTCLERNTARENPVPDDVILRMHQKYLAGRTLPLPVPERPTESTVAGSRYIPDPSLPRAVMVDIDGTVAIHGSRDPYDTSRYHEDTANAPVVAAVRAMARAGHEVVFCSGRDEDFRDVTEQWIDKHVRIPWRALYMRPPGDKRRDDVVKLELFDTHIRDAWNVTCVFDDRARVVGAWRSVGLTVFQVAEGNF